MQFQQNDLEKNVAQAFESKMQMHTRAIVQLEQRAKKIQLLTNDWQDKWLEKPQESLEIAKIQIGWSPILLANREHSTVA